MMTSIYWKTEEGVLHTEPAEESSHKPQVMELVMGTSIPLVMGSWVLQMSLALSKLKYQVEVFA